MKTIPLYDPLPAPPIPPTLTRTHYQDMAREAEQTLHAFLGLPPEVGVLLVDRATHGLELCFRALAALHTHQLSVVLPKCTFRSVRDAAELAGCRTGSTDQELSSDSI